MYMGDVSIDIMMNGIGEMRKYMVEKRKNERQSSDLTL